MIGIMTELQARLAQISCPILVMHGEEDKLCELSGSKMLHQIAISSDKTLKVSRIPNFTFHTRSKHNTNCFLTMQLLFISTYSINQCIYMYSTVFIIPITEHAIL